MEEDSKSQSQPVEEVVSGSKRSREASPELESAVGDSSPETKRLREELLLDDILDDSTDVSTAGDAATAGGGDLASFMKSFEDEIAFTTGSPPSPQVATHVESSTAAAGQPDLGFLLEASDDELGLPPPSSSPEDSVTAAAAIAGGEENENDEVGFGQIWGVEEDNGFGFESEFGIRPELVGEDNGVNNGVLFDGGLFDYADVVASASSDQFGFRSETLPAV